LSLPSYKPIVLIAAIALSLTVPIAVISAYWPRYEERFFELGLLGEEERTERYYPNNNSTLEIGSLALWNIYIHNHMGTPQNVSIRVKLLNSTMQTPDNREHVPSPFSHFVELPLSLGVDETKIVPFAWSIGEVDYGNDSVTIRRLVVNNQTFNVEVSALLDNRYRIIFELWVYDQSTHQYAFGWDSGKEFYSASLYMWFSVAPSE